MLDPKFIRENRDVIRKALEDRNDPVDRLDRFFVLDEERKTYIKEVEDLKCRKNASSKKIGELIKAGQDAEEARAEVKTLTEKITGLDEKLKEVEEGFSAVLAMIPNVPHESVPIGKSSEDNKLVKEVGDKPLFRFKPRDHVEIGKMNGLFDLERGAKISGAGFPVFRGPGARLERALINFMLDIHTKEHGYTEFSPPFIVNKASMYGTGQLPKLAEDMYKLSEEDMYLIPTAEVPVTNLHAGEVLEETSLPLCYTAYTPCFRREAGSYGKDTKGLIRVHQFDKVEMVKFTTPETSMEEHEKLLADAEDILLRLDLPYRVLVLCTGDMSFAAHKCYDIELWAPGSDRWLEVSSCSVFSDFQARRANIKYQPDDRTGKPRFVHTLNASGVALPRLVVAILEIYQQEDGSVLVPEALRPYFGKDKIEPGMA
ncbi:MAG: serine--tRNA ligase [Candidatus Omnitrophica bacterium]|nr:serine--tRNA ligase [Candidatus Omnitrophota bacterium]MDD5488278.1 serine--tRNA ligase [Candidatus Omnitrophota bacterium]